MSRRTRKQRAVELLSMLEHGPAFSNLWGDKEWDDPEYGAAAQYRLWARSWILREVKDLVPELRNVRKELGDEILGSM